MTKINYVGTQLNAVSGAQSYVEGWETDIDLLAAGAITAGDFVAWKIDAASGGAVIGTVVTAPAVALGNPSVVGVAVSTVASGARCSIRIRGLISANVLEASGVVGTRLVGSGATAGRGRAVVAADTGPHIAYVTVAAASGVDSATVFVLNPQGL